jgi:uncharacterized protein
LGGADIGGNVVVVSFAPVPATAAWHHRGARSGFEVAYFGARGDRCQIEGWTTAIEDGTTWAVEYAISGVQGLRWPGRRPRIGSSAPSEVGGDPIVPLEHDLGIPSPTGAVLETPRLAA